LSRIVFLDGPDFDLNGPWQLPLDSDPITYDKTAKRGHFKITLPEYSIMGHIMILLDGDRIEATSGFPAEGNSYTTLVSVPYDYRDPVQEFEPDDYKPGGSVVPITSVDPPSGGPLLWAGAPDRYVDLVSIRFGVNADFSNWGPNGRHKPTLYVVEDGEPHLPPTATAWQKIKWKNIGLMPTSLRTFDMAFEAPWSHGHYALISKEILLLNEDGILHRCGYIDSF
jgi:hypothetical protein